MMSLHGSLAVEQRVTSIKMDQVIKPRDARANLKSDQTPFSTIQAPPALGVR